MRQKRIVIIGLMCLIMSGGTGSALAGEMSLPAAEGKAVYDYITRTNPYQNWALFPGKGVFYKGAHPHGALLTTYISDGAFRAIQRKSGRYPDNSFIIKENYMPDKKLDAVTVMYRVKGYNAEGGDWFWAKYSADGSILQEGKVGGCIGCHAAVIKDDWVFTGSVK